MTDHREDIRDAADRHTQYARWAMMAERGDLHDYDTADDESAMAAGEPNPGTCAECGVSVWDHAPAESEEFLDGLAGLLLDVDALTSADGERWRVELLLTCGGPTVWMVVDSRWSTVEFHHSWGRDRAYSDACPDGRTDSAPDRAEIELSGDDADVWREVAMMAAGVDA